jgi:parallel beta-helix repeat protein
MGKLQKKIGLIILLLEITLILAGFITVKSENTTALQTIIIQPDGSISPSTVPINHVGNTYTFTDNIYATMKIQKSNIVLDGAGYTLSGSYNGTQADVWVVGSGPPPQGNLDYTIGIDLSAKTVEGITIENLNIKNFSVGMYIWTKNNTITHNTAANNIVGVLLSGSNNTVSDNCIANNIRGLFFGFTSNVTTIPTDMLVFGNAFEHNDVQLNGCMCIDYNSSEATHNWDWRGQGNFWSDYNGTDTNGDGIGDAAYTIDILNQDRYPLMESPVQPPVPASQISTALILFIGAFITIVVFVVFLMLRWVKK